MENKLIRILDKSFMEQYEKRGLLTAQHTASDLLANGVIVQKQGELIKTEEPLGWRDVECVKRSVCRESWIIDEDGDFEDYAQFWNYCPERGAKLKEREG